MIADDQRNLLTVAMICNAILLLFVLLGLLISPPIDALSAWRSNLPGVIFGLVFLLLGSIAFVRRRRWQRVNQRRQAAARGGVLAYLLPFRSQRPMRRYSRSPV